MFEDRGYFQMKPNGLRISLAIHKENRTRVLDELKAKWSQYTDVAAIKQEEVFIVLQGGTNQPHGDSDCDEIFRQESYFHWTFGGIEPDYFGTIQLSTGKTCLFVPKVTEGMVIVSGAYKSHNVLAEHYGVDEVHDVDHMNKILEQNGAKLLLTLHGLNTDSNRFTREAQFQGIDKFKVNKVILHPVMSECRVIKSARELEIIRYTNEISSAAHRHLMRTIKPGMFQYHAEADFLHYCYNNGGMRHASYTCIGASGCDCAILHYGHAGAPNSKEIKDGDLCLFDMGGEYYCYSSDITCTWPVNGKFSAEQKIIYEAVLDANLTVLQSIKPGVLYSDLHKVAEKTILTHLKNAGLLKGDLDRMMEARLGFTFMPHGLGHLMGCDTHDVGGYNSHCPPRSTEPGLDRLRTARPLQANMVLTVEPGCYFVDLLLKKAKASPELRQFLIPEEIEKYIKVGGVRIEDNIVVTETGYEMLTDVPRTVEEVEKWISGN